MENQNNENKGQDFINHVTRLMRRQNTSMICPLRSSDNKIVYCGCECAWYNPYSCACIIVRPIVR